MKPLWKIRSGQFAGWRTEDGQFYDDEGTQLGYFMNELAYFNDGRAIGEIYDERWLGKRETITYPMGGRWWTHQSRDPARLPDRNGIPLAGWTDPEF